MDLFPGNQTLGIVGSIRSIDLFASHHLKVITHIFIPRSLQKYPPSVPLKRGNFLKHTQLLPRDRKLNSLIEVTRYLLLPSLVLRATKLVVQ